MGIQFILEFVSLQAYVYARRAALLASRSQRALHDP